MKLDSLLDALSLISHFFFRGKDEGFRSGDLDLLLSAVSLFSFLTTATAADY